MVTKNFHRRKQTDFLNPLVVALLSPALFLSTARAFVIQPVRFGNHSPSSSMLFSTREEQTSITTKDATKVALSFQVECEFDPPGALSNQHVQTIGGFLCRQKGIGSSLAKNDPLAIPRLVWEFMTTDPKEEEDQFWSSRERIETPDGDWFHADTLLCDATTPSTPTVMILHGLESNSDSMLTKDMARVIVEECNMHCTCINFRGCTGTPNDTVGGYHLGFTDDLVLYLKTRKQQTAAPSYLTGFSLGANAILKCLGELGTEAQSAYNIQGGVALCAPLDQERNSVALAQPGINRIIYTNMLLRTMKQKATEQYEQFGDSDKLFDYPRAMAAETITDFDDAFIAPIYGFKDCYDYYRQTSSIHYIDRITVPTLIINARDDPFLDPDLLYVEKDNVPVRMVSMPHGGHLGFAFHQTASPSKSSWLTNEMGRFLRHIRENEEAY